MIALINRFSSRVASFDPLIFPSHPPLAAVISPNGSAINCPDKAQQYYHNEFVYLICRYLICRYREYLNQKISEISDKTNVFAYLHNPNQTISQRNIAVNSFGFWNNSPYKYNKKAYDVTLQQHAPPNHYNSIIGFKLNDAGTGKFTIVFEIYTTKISNINISSVADSSTINKETQINLVDHTKLITQINIPSLQNNDYLYYKITGNSTQATIKTHIIVYGVSGWVDSVDNKIYDNIIYYLDNMFEYDNG